MFSEPTRYTKLLAVFVLFTLFAGDFWRNTLSWGGFLALAFALAVLCAVAVVRSGALKAFDFNNTPKLLVAFVLFAGLSIAWSFYPGASALGYLATLATTSAGVFLALRLTWPQLVLSLDRALRIIVWGSLAFELIVALFIRVPVIPLWVSYPEEKLPKAFYWSQGLIFEGGPVQGIVGNRNLLAFIAVLLLLTTIIRAMDQAISRSGLAIGLVLAVGTLGLTRSATAIAILLVAAVALAFVVVIRRVSGRMRVVMVSATLVVTATGGTLAAVFSDRLLGVLGKSSDLTGRTDIWAAVSDLIAERPAVGWGWVSYWAPWVEPFNDLAVRKGVLYLQAHNAWLDVTLQLGIVGLVLFALLALGALWRSWWLAVDPQRDSRGTLLPYRAVTLFPIILMVILLTQSLVESRILVEAGWALFVAVIVATKLGNDQVDRPLEFPQASANQPRFSRAIDVMHR